MAIQWLRLWHEMPNDPKWRTIARASKQPISAVIAVYLHLLVAASANASERGRTESVCIEDLASALDLESEQVTQIMEAMQGRVLEGEWIAGWEKRQVEREDGSAARAKAWREAQKELKKAQANAGERKKTPEEEKDKDTDKEPLTTPDGVVVASYAGNTLPTGEIKPDCPHQQIIALYHEILPMCPQVRDWTPARAQQLRCRWNEDKSRQSLDYWRRFFEYVKTCGFLVGIQPNAQRRPFFADLEWLTKSGNFTKIRERKYES